MVHKAIDRVKETSVSTGTGDFTLAGAMTGYQSFNTAYSTGATNLFPYVIEDLTTGDWEVGYTYLSGATALVRGGSQVLVASSNGGSAVNFGAGTKRVYSAVHSQMLKGARTAVICLYPTTPDGNVAAGTNLCRTVMRGKFFVTKVFAYVKVSGTTDVVTIDINLDGVTMLSTKLTIDPSENDSSTAAAAAVISVNTITNGQVISVDVDDDDGGNTAAGLEVQLCGYWLEEPT